MLTSSELENYVNDIKVDENIQILNANMTEIITCRQVSTKSMFFVLKFYDFGNEIFVVKCQCENSQSAKWEDTFVEILNSVKKIEDGKDENNGV